MHDVTFGIFKYIPFPCSYLPSSARHFVSITALVLYLPFPGLFVTSILINHWERGGGRGPGLLIKMFSVIGLRANRCRNSPTNTLVSWSFHVYSWYSFFSYNWHIL